MKKYSLSEIFLSIQGEGSFVGTSSIFIRLAGCNKWNGNQRQKPSSICSFCDTDFKPKMKLSASEIAQRILKLPTTSGVVVLTGGEPMLQVDEHLLSTLRDSGFDIHLETNGSFPLGDLEPLIDHITLSPKQSMEETRLERCHDLKILFPPIHKEITYEGFLMYSFEEIFFQPIYPEPYDLETHKRNLEETIEKVHTTPDSRISIQAHKAIGVR